MKRPTLALMTVFAGRIEAVPNAGPGRWRAVRDLAVIEARPGVQLDLVRHVPHVAHRDAGQPVAGTQFRLAVRTPRCA